MMKIDARLANAGSTVRLRRATARTVRALDELLSLLQTYRPFGLLGDNDTTTPVHVLAWSHDGLFGGKATSTGLWLKTPRGFPFVLADLLEIRLFAPGLEIHGHPDETDRRFLTWHIFQEADDGGWCASDPILFPAHESAGDRVRCLTAFHHVFGTRLHGPYLENAIHPVSSVFAQSEADFATKEADSVPETQATFWLLEEGTRGIRWEMSAGTLERREFGTNRIRHSWGGGANLFLAVRNYLQASPADGSLSTIATCLGGYWRLGEGDRTLEEVLPV